MTEAELVQIEQRAKKAKLWRDGQTFPTDTPVVWTACQNSAWDVPVLVAEVRRLQAERDELLERVDAYQRYIGVSDYAAFQLRLAEGE